MREHTTICKVDVGQDLNDLKNEMLYCLDYFEHRNHPVYGILMDNYMLRMYGLKI